MELAQDLAGINVSTSPQPTLSGTPGTAEGPAQTTQVRWARCDVSSWELATSSNPNNTPLLYEFTKPVTVGKENSWIKDRAENNSSSLTLLGWATSHALALCKALNVTCAC